MKVIFSYRLWGDFKVICLNIVYLDCLTPTSYHCSVWRTKLILTFSQSLNACKNNSSKEVQRQREIIKVKWKFNPRCLRFLALSTNVGDGWRLRKLRCNFFFNYLSRLLKRLIKRIFNCYSEQKMLNYHKAINRSHGILILSLVGGGAFFLNLFHGIPIECIKCCWWDEGDYDYSCNAH